MRRGAARVCTATPQPGLQPDAEPPLQLPGRRPAAGGPESLRTPDGKRHGDRRAVAGRARDGDPAPERLDPVAEPGETRAPRWIGSPDPVVAHRGLQGLPGDGD